MRAANEAGPAAAASPRPGPSAAASAGLADGPARIVSLAPAITETIFALGLGGRVVGVSTHCDYPDEARRLPKVGTFSEPVAEAIVALHPDLVLTSPSPGNETSVRAIERAGVRVAVVQSEGGLQEARSAMLDVARAVGAPGRGEALVASIDARLAAVRAAAAPLDHPAAAVVVGREPLILAGPASYLGELLTLAGGTNVADAIGGRWPRVGLEFLVVSAPQVLVDLSVAMEQAPQPRAAPPPGQQGQTVRQQAQPVPMPETARDADPSAAWSSLASVPAVANRRVVVDRASVMLRPGPRLAEAAEALFAALHPGLASTSDGAAGR